MSRLSIKLNKKHKSFDKDFQYVLEGDLILLSGVNGGGKSQIIDIINGQQGRNANQKIESSITIDGENISTHDIE